MQKEYGCNIPEYLNTAGCCCVECLADITEEDFIIYDFSGLCGNCIARPDSEQLRQDYYNKVARKPKKYGQDRTITGSSNLSEVQQVLRF